MSQQLYAPRRTPSPNIPDVAKLDVEQLEIYETTKYVQQFLNITMGGHWCIEQTDSLYGSIQAVDRPIDSICYAVWHGDCSVGSIEVDLESSTWDHSNGVTVSAILHWADCFDARQVRGFFTSISRIHDSIFDHNGDQIMDVEKIIDRSMQDALWDAFAFQKQGALDGFYRELHIGGIEMSFEGDLGRYKAMLDKWKLKAINIYELEKERISSSNRRFNR